MSSSTLSFCPKCGKSALHFKQDRYWFCKHCDFQLYHNVAGATAALLFYEHKLLLVERAKEPSKGKWDLPGGFIDPKETAEQGLCRELNEELDINIKEEELIYMGSEPNTYHYKEIMYNTIDWFYAIKLKNRPKNWNKDEIEHLKWLSESELKWDELAFDSQKNFFQKHKKRLPW